MHCIMGDSMQVTSGEDKKEKLVENKLAQDFARLTLLGLSFSDAFIQAF